MASWLIIVKVRMCHVFVICSQAYEKGIALFRWPNVYDLWSTYLTKFIDRYGGKKLERARDLFEQCLDGCPEQFVKGNILYTLGDLLLIFNFTYLCCFYFICVIYILTDFSGFLFHTKWL